MILSDSMIKISGWDSLHAGGQGKTTLKQILFYLKGDCRRLLIENHIALDRKC